MPLRTDAEILAAIETEEALALDSQSGELQRQRTDALARYRGEPLGDEQPGRSSVVDKSVLDTIEWIMPSLHRIYDFESIGLGQFESFGPEDDEAAKAETEACNWYLTAKNDTFSHVGSTIRDALLLKNGYIVGMWKTDETRITETYKGLADEEIALLMDDKQIKVVEHSEYPDPFAPAPMMAPMGQQSPQPPPIPGGPSSPAGPPMAGAPPGPPPPPPMLHDVKIERVRPDEYVAIESIPPEEIIVARRHRWTSLMDADFVQWRRRVSVGQLRAEGFDIPDDVPDFNDFTQETTQRARFQENERFNDQTSDPSRKIVQFKDTYMQLDMRGKGSPQLWRICHIAGDDKIILKEEADLIPFAAFSPIIYPHSHIGSSVYDLIQDLSLIKTALQRGFLDNLYVSLNNEKVVNIDAAGEGLDDWLVSRPGGIKRCHGDPNAAFAQIQPPNIGDQALAGLQYIDELNDQRTGISRATIELDPNAINKTATAAMLQQSAASQRIELIARTLAGGFKDLFLIIHALACKHSTKPLQMKLHGKWTKVNPREWTTRTDFSISVGMGTGNPEVQLQKLQLMAPLQQQLMQLGLAGPMEAYNLACEFYKVAGYRNHEKFIHPPEMDPQTGQPKPPPQPPDPAVQVAQIKAQADQQTAQMDMQMKTQFEQARAQAQAQIEAAQAQADVAVQQHKVEASNQLEMAKARMQLEVDAAKHEREQRTQIMIANIKAANALEIARVNQQIEDGKAVLQRELKDAGQGDAAAMLDVIQKLHEQVAIAAGPKEFVRGPDGKVAGIKAANGAMQKVARGPDGRATGLQ